MSRFKITCCMDCPDRIPGCHGYCERYKQQKTELEATKEEQNKKRAIQAGLDASLYDRVERTAKRTHYRENKRKGK